MSFIMPFCWFDNNNSGEKLFSLAVAGDMSTTAVFRKLILNERAETKVHDAVRAYFKGSDFSVVNLENPICNSDVPINKTGPNLKSVPGTGAFLKRMGINTVNLSNNHIMDFGAAGFNETITELKQNEIEYFGAGKNREAASDAYFIKYNGIKAAILGFSECEFACAGDDSPGAAPIEIQANCANIGQISQKADFVIVFVHAGNEYQFIPSPRIQRVYREMIDAGADLIIGSHPHVPQGAERYKHGFIFYSLGNFLFDYKVKDKLMFSIGFVLKIDFNKDSIVSIDLKAVELNGNNEVNFIKKQDNFYDYINCASKDLGNPLRLTSIWEQEVINLYDSYKYFFDPGVKSVVLNKLFGFKNAKTFLNMFQCPSHADVLHTMLKLIYNGRLKKDPHIQNYLSELRIKLISCYD